MRRRGGESAGNGPSDARAPAEDGSRVLVSASSALSRGAAPRAPRERARGALDGFVLLEAAHVELPSDATKADVNDRGLHEVQEEDLALFPRLSWLDAGENALRVEDLTNLSALEELRLPCNGVAAIAGWKCASPFPLLVIMDLSYNALRPESVAMLAQLARLRELDITCNELGALPDNLSAFGALEVLLAAHNGLQQPECLLSLGRAPRLREVDLGDNAFMAVPDGVQFDRLEWLSLVNNRVAFHADVEALLSCPELTQVLLYGNPITRATAPGPGPALAASAASATAAGGDAGLAASRWSGADVINVVTAAPGTASRRPARRGRPRRLYSHFKIVKVHDLELRRPSEWRSLGKEMQARAAGGEGAAASRALPGTAAAAAAAVLDDHDDDESDEDLEEPANSTTYTAPIASPVRTQAQPAAPKDKGKAGASIFLTEPSLLEEHNNNNNNHHHQQQQQQQQQQHHHLGHNSCNQEGEQRELGEEERGKDDSVLSHSLIVDARQQGQQAPEEGQQGQQQRSFQRKSELLELGKLTSTGALRAQLARFAADDEGSSPRGSQAARHAKPNPAKLRSAITSLRHALAHPLTSHVAVQEAEFAQGGLGCLDDDDDDAVDEAVLAEVRAAARGQRMLGKHHFEQLTSASKSRMRGKVPFNGYAREQLLLQERIEARAQEQGKPRLAAAGREIGLGLSGSKEVLDSIEAILDRINVRTGERRAVQTRGAVRDETDDKVDGLLRLVNSVMDSFEQ
jgi:hypothetical protein